MKTCPTCGVVKEYSFFYKNKRTKDGFAHVCKACADQSNTKTRLKNPEKNKTHRLRAAARLRQQMQEYKVQLGGCQMCGESHPAVLELHHLDPDVKDFHPSSASSMAQFKREADKCVVLCANCHRKVHAEQSPYS